MAGSRPALAGWCTAASAIAPAADARYERDAWLTMVAVVMMMMTIQRRHGRRRDRRAARDIRGRRLERVPGFHDDASDLNADYDDRTGRVRSS